MSYCQNRHYEGEEGTLFYVDCGIDVSTAINIKILLERPDGTKIQKEGTIAVYRNSSHFVSFVIESPDFNQSGKYIGQVHLTKDGWSGWGKPFSILIEEPVSSSSSSSSS